MKEVLLRLENIHKSFGPIKALKNVHIEVGKGEVHALIGENGAGKSTLMKVLSGAHSPDSGTMTFNGQPYQPESPAMGRAAGIAMIYQELILAPHMTIEENVMLGIEQSSFGFVKNQTHRVKEALEWLGQGHIDPKAPIRSLSIGKQQLVEIARALVIDAKVVIMDEPTSSLSAADSQALFQVIRKLKDKNISVIYISHFLEEVKQISDRFTILRDGETITSGDMASTSIPELITHMIGRSVEELYPAIPHEIGDVVLEVNHIHDKKLLKDITFKLRKGEILGISGLVGAGRSETIRSIFGLESLKNGTIKIKNHPEIKAMYLDPHTALKKDLDLLSENRKEEGLAINLPIYTNITLSALKNYSKFGILNLKKEFENATEWSKKLRVKSKDPAQPVSALSGGNQQKVCIARLLHHDSDILFLDEPTRGIDVGSKAEIYKLIQNLALLGKSIVVVSSYLPELMGICDTLAVMHRGELSHVKKIKDWSQQDIMLFATSGVAS